MRGVAQRSIAPVAVLAALTVSLVVLALLQYRWISQVSDADRERIQAGLENSVRQFRQEFNRELLDLCRASELRRGPEGREDRNRVADRLENWLQVAPYAGIVSDVYLWETDDDDEEAKVLRLDHSSRSFEPAEKPDVVEAVEDLLDDRRDARRRLRFGEGRIFIWSVLNGMPLIIHPMFGRRREERRSFPRVSGYMVIELDREFLGEVALPELAQRYFRGPEEAEYDVAVLDTEGLDSGGSGELLYRSSDDLTTESFRSADIRTGLLWEPRDYFAARDENSFEGGAGLPPPGQFSRGPGPAERRPPPGPFPPQGPFEKRLSPDGPRGSRSPLILLSFDEPGWQLAVRHREGSLESAVTSLRRRNLAISFGILILLTGSVGMIYVSAQRARRLADLQMEFVAGVSHELRTPLAVIRSAADNLAEGVIASGPQVHQYGKLIRSEGRRLSTMIEQTLLFAGAQTGPKAFPLANVSVESVVGRTLKDLKAVVEEAGFQVETSMEPGLPAVRSNEDALSRVLANLVQNAVKYGGEAKWMAVRAARSNGTNGSREVEIHVEDRGPGIDATDLPHLFEPFYRGKLALSNQIQGSGLGLNLAQRISRAVGARLTVETRPGRGSSFVLHLPVAEENSGPFGQPS
ncbi:MAG: HAMP domain-containing sensor histidine kinase [Bryobacterales bacterium]